MDQRRVDLDLNNDTSANLKHIDESKKKFPKGTGCDHRYKMNCRFKNLIKVGVKMS